MGLISAGAIIRTNFARRKGRLIDCFMYIMQCLVRIWKFHIRFTTKAAHHCDKDISDNEVVRWSVRPGPQIEDSIEADTTNPFRSLL